MGYNVDINNLRTRRRKAATLALMASGIVLDANEQVKSVVIPGTNAYRRVLVKRLGVREVEGVAVPCLAVECLKLLPYGNVDHCEGNHVCYHGMAAVMVAARKQGREVHWAGSKDVALASLNLLQFQNWQLGYCFAKRGTRLFSGMWFLWRE